MTMLFAVDGVIGSVLSDEFDNGSFGVAVGFGDFALIGFTRQGEVLALEIWQRDRIGSVGDANG